MLGALAFLAIAQGDDFTLAYEKSGFKATGHYEEAVAFCRKLERASPFAKVIEYGTSPEGRKMVALLVSKDQDFSERGFRHSNKPDIFIENGIHSGEIEGKDATLMLLRDMLINGKKESLLDGANFVVVPVFGLDAHERFTAYNRINQNGPVEMGWRASAQNLNLNRDFVKADGGEMRAQIQLLHRYKPDFFFDNHTTDGANFVYQVTFGIPVSPALEPNVCAWDKAFNDAISAQCDADGWPNGPYFDLMEPGNPAKGLSVEDFSPRYSNGYLAALDRPSLLIETHMLKPYKQRVDCTYEVMDRTIQYVIKHAKELKSINDAADKAALDSAGKSFVLGVRNDGTKRPFVFKGYEYTPYHSEVTDSMIPSWDTSKPVNIPTTVMDSYAPSVTVTAPAGYAVPAPWVDALDRLKLHGVHFTSLKRTYVGEFDTFKFEGVKFGSQSFESRFMPSFKSVAIKESRTLPPGTAIVPVNQENVRLILQMLEPDAPDSLMHWGFFNVVFEGKEYFEAYAMEPIAKKMMDSDPALKAEFQERLKDEAFAKNSRARLNFFFERSPYFDNHLNKYPVVRLSAEQLKALGG